MPPVQLAVKAGCIVPLTVMGLPKVVGAVFARKEQVAWLRKRQPPEGGGIGIETNIRTNFNVSSQYFLRQEHSALAAAPGIAPGVPADQGERGGIAELHGWHVAE